MAREARCPTCSKWAEIVPGERRRSRTTGEMGYTGWRFREQFLANHRSVRTCGCDHHVILDRVPRSKKLWRTVDSFTGEEIDER